MKRHKRLWAAGERGAATMIEAAIVLPICLLIVLFVFCFGFFLNQMALLESAAERGILLVQKLYNDPNADALLDLSYGQSSAAAGYRSKDSLDNIEYDYDPYRYWGKYETEGIAELVEGHVEEIIRNAQLVYLEPMLGVPEVHYENAGGLISKSVSITVEQDFKLFPVVRRLLVPNMDTSLRSEAHMNIVSQTEFVRNTDFICDMVERLAAGTGVEALIEKIQSVFDKIGQFFTG